MLMESLIAQLNQAIMYEISQAEQWASELQVFQYSLVLAAHLVEYIFLTKKKYNSMGDRCGPCQGKYIGG